MGEKPTNMQQLLGRIETGTEGSSDSVELGSVLEAVGSRSFGPVLLLPGLILFSPLSGIPGVPTTMGVFTLLISLQIIFRRRTVWLPRWLLHRKMPRQRVERALRWLRKPARVIDRILKPRLSFLVSALGIYAVAATCSVIALSLPIMEFVLFSASSAGLVLALFGLALTARDGLLALIAFLIAFSTYAFIGMQLL
jgi:hypothetical protein